MRHKGIAIFMVYPHVCYDYRDKNAKRCITKFNLFLRKVSGFDYLGRLTLREIEGILNSNPLILDTTP